MTRNDVLTEKPAYRAHAYKSKNSNLTAVSAVTIGTKQKLIQEATGQSEKVHESEEMSSSSDINSIGDELGDQEISIRSLLEPKKQVMMTVPSSKISLFVEDLKSITNADLINIYSSNLTPIHIDKSTMLTLPPTVE